MKFPTIFISFLLAGCSTLNVFRGQDEFCRQLLAGYQSSFGDAISREIREEPPSGELTQQYSRELWDDYWNSRIYHMWDVGPEGCGGTYSGPTGPIMLQYALDARRAKGLPKVNLDLRNADKDLQP